MNILSSNIARIEFKNFCQVTVLQYELRIILKKIYSKLTDHRPFSHFIPLAYKVHVWRANSSFKIHLQFETLVVLPV